MRIQHTQVLANLARDLLNKNTNVRFGEHCLHALNYVLPYVCGFVIFKQLFSISIRAGTRTRINRLITSFVPDYD